MKQSKKFLSAKEKLTTQIVQSRSKEDASHAENTMYWVQQLEPEADELLLLAGFGHDVERSLPDRYSNDMFPSYDQYKRAHAARSGKVVAEVMSVTGYTPEEAARVAHIIAEGEFHSNESDVQLLCDADSISFFDNNLKYYLEDKGEEDTRQKMRFMYERTSRRAQSYIRITLQAKPELNLLHL